MKRFLPLLIVLLAGIGLFLLPKRSRPLDRVPSPRPDAPPITAPNPEPAIAPAELPALTPASVADVRRSLRENPSWIRKWITILEDPSTPSDQRNRIALLLGSLDHEEAWGALLDSLSRARDPRWIRILLFALGSDRENPDDDDRFAEAGSPWVFELEGWHVRIRHDLLRDDARSAVLSFLQHPDADVRRAAVEALQHSMDHFDARQRLASALDAESEVDVRAGSAAAVAGWIERQRDATPERFDLIQRLLRHAVVPEEDVLRIRIRESFGATSMTDAEARQMLAVASGGPPEARRWSLEIAAQVAERLPTTFARDVAQCAERIRDADPDVKVREGAVRVLARFAPGDETARKALFASFSDAAWSVRCQAVRGIRRLDSTPETRALLQQAAADPDERVRLAATE